MRRGHRPDVGACSFLVEDIRTVAANAPTAKRPLVRRDPNHITTSQEVCALAAAIAVASQVVCHAHEGAESRAFAGSWCEFFRPFTSGQVHPLLLSPELQALLHFRLNPCLLLRVCKSFFEPSSAETV
ncbi:unnamed protein product [Symbiodinium sp. CCMP2592]|nr:unnamed protein product [Symbiodinium sp. CCMP2592]